MMPTTPSGWRRMRPRRLPRPGERHAPRSHPALQVPASMTQRRPRRHDVGECGDHGRAIAKILGNRRNEPVAEGQDHTFQPVEPIETQRSRWIEVLKVGRLLPRQHLRDHRFQRSACRSNPSVLACPSMTASSALKAGSNMVHLPPIVQGANSWGGRFSLRRHAGGPPGGGPHLRSRAKTADPRLPSLLPRRKSRRRRDNQPAARLPSAPRAQPLNRSKSDVHASIKNSLPSPKTRMVVSV